MMGGSGKRLDCTATACISDTRITPTDVSVAPKDSWYDVKGAEGSTGVSDDTKTPVYH